MITISVWLLIVISAGHKNEGNVEVIAKFANVYDCIELRKKLSSKDYYADFDCYKANILVMEK